MRTRGALFGFSLVLSLPALSGCGAGAPAEAIRPTAPTSSEALGEAECRDVSEGGEPLVVDWKPDQRGELELAMGEGVAVVAYSCDGIKLLKDCRIDGSYGFLGMTRKEQVVRLQNADELRANLPLSGASLGGELARGSSLDIAMIMIGRAKTTWSAPTEADLQGEGKACAGATHFVRSATLGAFAVDTGSNAKVRAAAEIFGAGASGGSTSDKQVQSKEGDLKDCAKASPKDGSPPSQCGAPIRLVLQPIVKKSDAAPAETAQAPAEVASTEPTCPKGLVLADGKCMAAASAPAYQCEAKNAEECKSQCAKKHPGSCATLGALYMNGQGIERDPARAAEASKTACDGGEAAGCTQLGILTAEGTGVTKDVAASLQLFEKACNAAEAIGCGRLGRAYLTGDGVTADPARAATLLTQGCEGGDDRSCAAAAPLYASGKGVQADEARAAAFYKRACDGADAASCDALGQMHETGRGASKNPILASMLYQRGCIRGHGDACANQGRLELAKPGGNADAARRAFQQACTWRSAVGCAVLKAVYGENRPVMPDVAQQQALRKSCDSGNTRDCATLGVLSVASGNKAGGKIDLDRACTRGDAWACSVAKQLK
ncbi:tetratricopeptide repeat protein [Chondromyces crocatus]|uniref:Uncharacterized protein n=1 Tax=Chondromyces crocatus TaxID=52 RepID=A0A0K1EQH0_CHOCO|nr:tetratricopeptide repeat protein [Chondromyces crocatus]AKT42873.1 uncharacterized protein CMC5_071010 [Chondromyces crocatus]